LGLEKEREGGNGDAVQQDRGKDKRNKGSVINEKLRSRMIDRDSMYFQQETQSSDTKGNEARTK